MVSYTPWHFETKNDDIQKGMGRDRRGGSNDSPTLEFDSFDEKSLSFEFGNDKFTSFRIHAFKLEDLLFSSLFYQNGR